MHSRFFLALILLTGASPVFAQHAGHDMSAMSDEEMSNMDMARTDSGMTMEHEEILGQPLGSGTSWAPAGSPVHEHAVHFRLGSWNLMSHGEFFALYSADNFNNKDRSPPPTSGPNATQGSSFHPELERGGNGVDFPNWAMISAEHSAFRDDRVLLRAMMSLDPLTVGGNGYPLLFQTGEGLVDRQHAHDLFMELGMLYMHPVNENNRIFGYIGLPGEPALGPTAFMHRVSIGANPDAPLGHHSQDATHITYGVVTAGWIYRNFKADASAFNGREPDDNRWDIEVGPLDSYSARLAWNIKSFSLQGSGAFIHDPEAGEHADIKRITASAEYNKRVFRNPFLGMDLPPANWANTVVYGLNIGHKGGPTMSVLRESSLDFGRGSGWVRWEAVQRERTELDLAEAPDDIHWVHAITAGTGFNLFAASGLDFFLGGQMVFNLTESQLEGAYGNAPMSAQAFIKVRPSAMKMAVNP